MSCKYDLQESLNYFLKGVDVYRRFGSVEFNNVLTERTLSYTNIKFTPTKEINK